VESEEQSTGAILILFHLVLSSCTFYSSTKAWWSC